MSAAAPRPWIDKGMLLGLYLLAAASYAYAALIIDSGRDLAWGWSIASGGQLPLYGPSLNGLWQPGPVWYYLLALPLAVTGSVGASTLGIGMVAAAKIPLAASLGRHWQGPAFGLAFAAAIALPGWSTLGQMVLSHTVLVEVAVVATLWCALRAWQRDSCALATSAALVLGLAVHAHPTALTAAPAVVVVGVRLMNTPRRAWLAPIALLAFLLPFAPMLWSEARIGWPQWDASTGYFGHSDYFGRIARAPAVLWGASHGEIVFVRDTLLARWSALAAPAAIALFALFLAAGAGLALRLRSIRAVQVALVLAMLAWGFVLLLRDQSPAWMVYACAPFGAALLALGWLGVWSERTRPVAATILASLAILLSALTLADRIATSRDGLQTLPGAAIADIAISPDSDATLRFWLPAWGHDALARRLCADIGPVSLHGDLATAYHFGQGVATALHCSDEHDVRLGGSATRQLAGIPSALAHRLGIAGEVTSWGHVLATPTAVLHPMQGARVVPHTRYLPDDFRQRVNDMPTRIGLSVPCIEGDLLVATNLLPLLNAPFELHPDNGAPLPPAIAETIASRYFACPPAANFRFDLVVLDPRAVDVFVLHRD
jgi:hypothetical protein